MGESTAVLLFVCAVVAVYLFAVCALVTLSKFGKKYESGLHREEQTWLYVTRGIGMEVGPARPLLRPPRNHDHRISSHLG